MQCANNGAVLAGSPITNSSLGFCQYSSTYFVIWPFFLRQTGPSLAWLTEMVTSEDDVPLRADSTDQESIQFSGPAPAAIMATVRSTWALTSVSEGQ
jgi:hypothetical protein